MVDGVNVSWAGSWFSVYLEDLLDACAVDDVGRISLAAEHRET
jgi:hypothetical protein